MLEEFPRNWRTVFNGFDQALSIAGLLDVALLSVEDLNWRELPLMSMDANGPEPTSCHRLSCCDAARRTCRSLQMRERRCSTTSASFQPRDAFLRRPTARPTINGKGEACLDSYLDIAHKVLRASRRPMSARGILDAAHRAQIVPEHLRGNTQHKTLQARLSEDILHHRSSSLFYRTEPGVFFLCELLSDPNTPEKFKEKFPARRRTRDLQNESPLGIDRRFLEKWREHSDWGSLSDFLTAAEKNDAVKYLPASGDSNYASVWTFSLVRRDEDVLSYRIGRYRDDREAFANKRTIGFPGAVTVSDRSLFSQEDYGATENALRVLLLDLDLSSQSFLNETPTEPTPVFVFEAEGQDGVSVVLIVLEWSCPDWFEPTTRRLSLNAPCWLNLSIQPNNIDDFEPWSMSTLRRIASREHAED